MTIPDNPRERREFVRTTRPDQYHSGPGTEDTPESGEEGKDSRIGDSGTTLRRREGDTRGREHEAGLSRAGEDEGEMVVLTELCSYVADKTNIRVGGKA